MVKITKAKLDKADRIILAELDKDCRIGANQLARLCRKSRQAVEYRIRRLVEAGIITSFNVAINPHKMGKRISKIYLKLRNIPERKEALLSFLRDSKDVYWMGECDGSWDLIFAFFASDDYVLYDLKNEMLSSFKDIIVDFYGDNLLDVKQYPKTFFTGDVGEPVEFAGKMTKSPLDELDLRILAHILGNGRAGTVEIARASSSTPSTVASRMKRMEEAGVIIQYRIGVDLSLLGLENYKAIIKLESHTKEEELALQEFIGHMPETQYFIRNIWQIEPEFVVADYEGYRSIIDSIRERFPNTIRRVESVILKTDEWTPGYRNLLKG